MAVAMRRGERQAWRDVAVAAEKVATASNFSEEWIAKIRLREAWAHLYGIPGTTGLPRSQA